MADKPKELPVRELPENNTDQLDVNDLLNQLGRNLGQSQVEIAKLTLQLKTKDDLIAELYERLS